MSLAWAGFAESCEFDAHVHACTCAQAMDPGHGTHVFITVLSTIYTPLPPQTPYKVEMESSQPHTPPPHGVDLWVFQMGLGWVSCGCFVVWVVFALGGGALVWV
jgi:hypothetical protein